MATNSQDLDLTVLLPVFNEEEALPAIIQEIKDVLDPHQWVYEILVIDDGSTDRSAELADSCGVRVVRKVKNSGSGSARRLGVIHAYGQIVCMLDADGSYDPSTIPEMMTYFPEYDQVNGARDKEKGTLPILRKPIKYLLRMFASYLARQHIPDLNTGLKAFKRNLMRQYLWVVPDGFSCVTTMTLAFFCNDHAVKYVPTRYRQRIGQSKFHPIKDTLKYFLTIIRIIVYFKPLSVFIPVSIFLFVMAIVIPLINYSTSNSSGLIFQQLSNLQVLLFLSAGITLIGGLLADLLVSTHRQHQFDKEIDNDRDST